MNFTKKYFLFFLVASIFSSCFSLKITWDPPTQKQFGWLEIPNANDSVYIKNISSSVPVSDGDFLYVDQNKEKLPKGLFYWRAKREYSPLSNAGAQSGYTFVKAGDSYVSSRDATKFFNPKPIVHPAKISELLSTVRITGIDETTNIGWLEVPEITTNGKSEAVRVKIAEGFKSLYVQEPGKATYTYIPKVGDNFDFDYVGSLNDKNHILKMYKGLFYWREEKKYCGTYLHGGKHVLHMAKFQFVDDMFYRVKEDGNFDKNNPFKNQMWGTPTLKLANKLDTLIPRRASQKKQAEQMIPVNLKTANEMWHVQDLPTSKVKLSIETFKESDLPQVENLQQKYLQSPQSFFQKYRFFPIVTGGLEEQFQFFRKNKLIEAKFKINNFDLENPMTWFKYGEGWRTFDGILAYKEADNLFYFNPGGGNRVYKAGNLKTETIGELNKKIFKQDGSIKNLGIGTFNVIAGTGTLNNPNINRLMDIGTMQADPKNKDAVFLLASNFHGLEARCNPKLAQAAQLMFDPKRYLVPFKNASQGFKELYPNQPPRSFLVGGATEMSLRAVQGENGAISAAPGFILKMYYKPFHSMLVKYANGMKINGKMIKLPVDDNGKVNFSGNNFQTAVPITPDELKPAFIKAFSENIEIPFLHDTEVIGGFTNVFNDPDYEGGGTDNVGNSFNHGKRAKFYHEYKGGTGQYINQVSTSALDLNDYQGRISKRGYGGGSNKSKRELLAQLLLYPMYEGVLKAAKANGKKKVFLTLVGAGSFKNKIKWVYNALEAQEEFIKNSGLDVYLVVFDRGAIGYPEIEQNIFDMVNRTGGTYTIYQGDKKYEFVDEKKQAEIRKLKFVEVMSTFLNELSKEDSTTNSWMNDQMDQHQPVVAKHVSDYIKNILEDSYKFIVSNELIKSLGDISKILVVHFDNNQTPLPKLILQSRDYLQKLLQPQPSPQLPPQPKPQPHTPPPATPPAKTPPTGVLGGLQVALPSLKAKLKDLDGELSGLLGGKGAGGAEESWRLEGEDYFKKRVKYKAGQFGRWPSSEGRWKDVLITLVEGDITDQYFSDPEKAAIVNAANKGLQGGGGVDAAIHSAAGPLAKHTQAVLEEMGYWKEGSTDQKIVKTGFALLTSGVNLSPLRIIHAIGPDVGKLKPNEDKAKLLTAAYQSSLHVAAMAINILAAANFPTMKHGRIIPEEIKHNLSGFITQVAFSSISTGIFNYPLNEAAHVTIKAIVDYLKTTQLQKKLKEIRIVTFGNESRGINIGKNTYAAYATALRANSELQEVTNDVDFQNPNFKFLRRSLTGKEQRKPLIFKVKTVMRDIAI